VPELPEVETIVRCLRPRLTGLEVRQVRVFFPPIIRRPGPAGLRPLAGRRVLGVRRRGKMIVIRLSGGMSLLFHLKMTGQLFFGAAGAPRDKHTRLAIAFRDSPDELLFRDVRKFGFALAVPTAAAGSAPELSRLGSEPLSLGFQDFRRAFAGRRGMIKARLLDQGIVAGIGNIYADEILFEAGIHPETDVSRLTAAAWRKLWAAVRAVLRRAIRHRGTTLRDYRDGDGEPGGFQARLRVYGREGLACPRCGAPVRRLRVAGRSSHFCPRCQRLGR
jgi:formamidopyrimidine-DNA glycosylase